MKCHVWEFDTEFGNYSRVDDEIKFKLYDKDGPEITMSPEQWQQLMKEMPEVIKVLTNEELEL